MTRRMAINAGDWVRAVQQKLRFYIKGFARPATR